MLGKTAAGLGVVLPLLCQALQELFPGGKRFLFLANAGLFVMLPLFDLGKNTRFLALTFEALERTVDAFTFFNDYEWH
jgi:hypothetical protein